VREATDRFQAEAAAQEVELRIDAPSAIAGSWDGPRVDQIVTNLVANALKYGARAPVDVVVRREGEEVEVSVRDRGIGIAAQDRGRIFERFERAASSRNYGGLGLGLWIAQEIARAHGGRIEVVSEPGAGSTFTLHLPISAPGSPADG
jgi:signal transduction histidine kinase